MDPKLCIKLLPPLFLLFLNCVSSEYWQVTNLHSFMKATKNKITESRKELWPDFQAFYYTQTLDHFNYLPESSATFQQKYIVNSKYWGGANTSSPIFVYTGPEFEIEYVATPGLMTDIAPRFKALLVYIEHRYYGESMPFGEESYQNSSTMGYFSSTQALADYAELIIDLKRNLSAQNSPVIVLGGSYGGMLASWFRLKYPHIAVGALASSAPILYFDGMTPENGYHVVVTKDFKEISESCYNTIRESWSEIDRVAATPNGLNMLSQKFNTCEVVNSSNQLKDSIATNYITSAQFNEPPYYPVKQICAAIDGLPEGSDVISRISAGYKVGFGRLFNNTPCNEISYLAPTIAPTRELGWFWQTCTEMVIPIGYHKNETMFDRENPFDLKAFTRGCQSKFGVTPRPHWITTEYGGHNITSVLKKFASNIIFSNGLQDPYSVGGVLQSISDSVVALYTTQGSHCLDLVAASTSDPDWLVTQRKKEVEIIQGWIQEYSMMQDIEP
ncbi:lysosomal Pro-Xaa carboxypeptidase [Ranunculus cassubicifolius]